MSVDPITLAMAKAYTDEKISGGGSGGGLPVVEIDSVVPEHEGEVVALSQEASSALDAISQTGQLFILRRKDADGNSSAKVIDEMQISSEGFVLYKHYSFRSGGATGTLARKEIMIVPGVLMGEDGGWVEVFMG